ncbi:hypothetical protein GY45DRAFT_1234387, partial [Cubamyces sp. BRFM 1775]
PLPTGLDNVAVIEPALTMLLLNTVLSSFLVPVLVMMFYFSTSTTCWEPIIATNVMTIAFTL